MTERSEGIIKDKRSYANSWATNYDWLNDSEGRNKHSVRPLGRTVWNPLGYDWAKRRNKVLRTPLSEETCFWAILFFWFFSFSCGPLFFQLVVPLSSPCHDHQPTPRRPTYLYVTIETHWNIKKQHSNWPSERPSLWTIHENKTQEASLCPYVRNRQVNYL